VDVVVGKNYRLQDIQLSKSQTLVQPIVVAATVYSTIRAPPGASRTAKPTPKRLSKVENTGLEPVTSWLQTRRSPS
jgi:hypothetical protein